ncbi:MAG: type II toxin-antitoxin system RelB/DinJ family antitoxin [Pyramidobacter sp.]|jgi:DNA-damage-inducible protein J
MSTSTINTRIDSDLKRQAENIFSEIGLSTSQAIRLFYKQTVQTGGLPFQPNYTLSKETLEAMREAEEGKLEEVTLDQLKAELNAIH